MTTLKALQEIDEAVARASHASFRGLLTEEPRVAAGYISAFEAAELELNVQDALDRVTAAERAAVREAVAGWAEQLGVTPEYWLRIYVPCTTVVYEGTTARISVKPALREDLAAGKAPQDFLTAKVP